MILIYTGNGKGKTSAALGNVFRALGHGWRVLVIQFFKGDWPVVFGEVEPEGVAGIEKLVTHHAIYQPKDLMMAQYSIPFCVALSVYRDPTDPASFDDAKLKDKKILAMMRKVRLKVDHEIEQRGWDRAARVTVRLGTKKHHALVVHFKGTPKNPMSDLEVAEKARKLVRPMLSENQLGRLVETIHNLEKIDDASKIGEILRTKC